MPLLAPALPAELPPHHRPISRILAALAAVVLASASALAGTSSSAEAAENTPPVAVTESYTVETGALLSVPAPGLLANDVDAESGVTIGLFIGANWGTTTVDYASGAFTYVSPPDFVGVDWVWYFVADAEGVLSNQTAAKVTVVAPGVSPEPEAPSLVANDDSYQVVPGQQFAVAAGAGPLANDVHSAGAAFSLNSFGQPYGVFSMQNDGAFTWQVPSDFCGDSTFTYDVTDGSITSNQATVALSAVSSAGDPVECASVDVPPTLVADDDLFFAMPGQSIVVGASSGLLSNDVHSEGGGFEVVSYTEPAGGDFALLADGSFTWTAPADFCDVLTFTYTAGNGVLVSNVATVTLYASESGGDVECEAPAEQPGEEPTDEPGSPTIPTLPVPTDPGTPGDDPELSDAPATPGRDTLAYTGAADELAQGIGWGALLAILLGLGLTASRLRRGTGA